MMCAKIGNRGLTRPDADMLAELCYALKLSPSTLLGVNLSKEELKF